MASSEAISFTIFLETFTFLFKNHYFSQSISFYTGPVLLSCWAKAQ